MNKILRALAGVCLCLCLLGACSLTGVIREARESVGEALKKDENYSFGSFETSEALTDPDFVDFRVARYLYLLLNDDQQEAYRIIYNEIFDQPEKIKIPKMSEEELSAVILAVKYDHPYLLCMDTTYSFSLRGSTYTLMPDYVDDVSVCIERSKSLIARAKAIVEEIPAEAADAFSRELWLHDHLCENCVYEDAPLCATAYGAIIGGRAICEGYALAAKLLFDIAGIDCVCVRGSGTEKDGKTVAHMWNAVRLDSGWYFLDSTWDDPVSADGEQNVVRHFYFNLPAAQFNANHSDYKLPERIDCVNTADNYYRRMGLFCEEDSWEEILEDVISSAHTGEKAELMFASQTLLEDVMIEVFEEGGINSYGANADWRRYGYSSDPAVGGLYMEFYE